MFDSIYDEIPRINKVTKLNLDSYKNIYIGPVYETVDTIRLNDIPCKKISIYISNAGEFVSSNNLDGAHLCLYYYDKTTGNNSLIAYISNAFSSYSDFNYIRIDIEVLNQVVKA